VPILYKHTKQQIMNRLIFLFSLLTLASIQALAQGQLIINGSLQDEESEGKTVYLKYPDEKFNEIILDSCLIENQKFTLKGSVVDMPTLASVETPDNTIYTLIVIEPGNIIMDFSNDGGNKKTTVKGTIGNDEFKNYMDISDLLSKQITEAGQSQNLEKYNQGISQFKNETFKYIYANANNRIGELLLPNAIEILDKKEVSQIFEKMRDNFRASELGQQLKMYLSQKDFSIGDSYEDIKLSNPDGVNISLSDYIGKNEIVLIDFWASWCGPCRKEMPHLIEAYQMYKPKGFEIVGISLDESEISWKNYIKSQNVTWPQMSDLKGWQSRAAQIYGVRSIPLTLLVDKKGTIIAKNLRGEELKQTLENLLK